MLGPCGKGRGKRGSLLRKLTRWRGPPEISEGAFGQDVKQAGAAFQRLLGAVAEVMLAC